MQSAEPKMQPLAIAGALAALLLATAPAAAQTYPAQDIHLICGYPAGSGADIIVRYYAEKLRAIAGRTVLVDNRTGALGNIATEYVARTAKVLASRLMAATTCSSCATSTGGFLNTYMLAASTPAPVR